MKGEMNMKKIIIGISVALAAIGGVIAFILFNRADRRAEYENS